MAVFDFCPNGQVPVSMPREPLNVMTMNGWTFSSKPTTPFVKKIKLTLHGLKWILTSAGIYDKTTSPTINAGRLEDFYETHETWLPFDWTHPHTGVTSQYRFAAALTVPEALPNSAGLIAPLELQFIEHNPGY